MGDALGAGVGAVSGTERVVDVGVGELGQRCGQFGVVLGLPRLEPDVLEHQHLARCEPLGQLQHARADHRRRECHRSAGQLSETIGDRSHRERRVGTLGTSEVRDHDEPGSTQAELLDRLERGPYTSVVGDPDHPVRIAPIERNVEIGAHEYAAADHVEVIDGHQRIVHIDQLHQKSLGLRAVMDVV